jgi:hypothetical protein
MHAVCYFCCGRLFCELQRLHLGCQCADVLACLGVELLLLLEVRIEAY